MEQPPDLAATFLAHARVRLALPGEAAELARLLRRAFETARARWPGVEVPAELFVRHLAARLPEASQGSPIEPLLEQLSLAELYLACACAHDVPAATATFEQHYLARLPALLGYLKQPATTIDDVCQLVRMSLLVRTSEGGPRIADYAGRGALLSWIRVTAARIALRLHAADKHAAKGDASAALDALPAPGVDLELDLIKRRYHGEFRQAVRDAFSALPSEERHLLRLYFVDRLSTPELGALFRVNQSTVSRWLKSARQTIYDETKRRLQERLGLSAREFASLLAVLNSQLDMSLSQLFEAQQQANEE